MVLFIASLCANAQGEIHTTVDGWQEENPANDLGVQKGVILGEGAFADVWSTTVGRWSFANSRSTSFGERSSADGSSSAYGNNAFADVLSVSVGSLSDAFNRSVAFGYHADADFWSVSLGMSAGAIEASTAVGYHAKASNYSTAIGSDSVADEYNTVSVGRLIYPRRIVNIDDGINEQDAVNIRQLTALSERVDHLESMTTGESFEVLPIVWRVEQLETQNEQLRGDIAMAISLIQQLQEQINDLQQ